MEALSPVSISRLPGSPTELLAPIVKLIAPISSRTPPTLSTPKVAAQKPMGPHATQVTKRLTVFSVKPAREALKLLRGL